MTKEQSLKTGYYIINLLKAVLRQECPPQKPTDISWEMVYQVARMHSVEAMTLIGAKQVWGDDDKELLIKWQNVQMQCITQGIVQQREGERILCELAKSKIKAVPLKGYLLSEMYPEGSCRQMADLDFLIFSNQMERAKDVMLQLGYRVESYGTSHHDTYLKKPWLAVELHKTLVKKSNSRYGYYKKIWKKILPLEDNGMTCRMTWEDFYIFLLVHFEKHFNCYGSGIKSVMDIFVFKNILGNELDRTYLEKELKKLHLLEFKKSMEEIAECWFGDLYQCEKDSVTQRDIEEALLFSGVYGNAEQWHKNHFKKLMKTYRFPLMAKCVHIFSRIFLPYKKMCYIYPVLRNYAILLPYYWSLRIFKMLLFERDRIRDVKKSLDKSIGRGM